MSILTDLYTDMRQYLLKTFNLPANDTTVIRGYNNLNPIPKNAIIMTFMQGRHLDQKSVNYDGKKQIIFNSMQGTMQLDFYGPDSMDRAQEVQTLWNSPYTTDTLINCVPLGNPRIRDLSFVNEAGMYELRFMIEADLQYNTKCEKTVNILEDVSQIDLESINAV